MKTMFFSNVSKSRRLTSTFFPTTCDVIVHFFLLEIPKTQSCIWAQNFQSKDQANLRRLNGRGAASFENVDEWGSGAHVILSAQCLGRGSWWRRSPSSLGSAAWGEVVVQLTLTITEVIGNFLISARTLGSTTVQEGTKVSFQLKAEFHKVLLKLLKYWSGNHVFTLSRLRKFTCHLFSFPSVSLLFSFLPLPLFFFCFPPFLLSSSWL